MKHKRGGGRRIQRKRDQAHEKQALYYPVAPSKGLTKIQRYYAPHIEDYTPHLSLIYGKFSTARRTAWLQKCPTYPEEIPCSHISLVLGGKEIQKWRILKTWILQKKKN